MNIFKIIKLIFIGIIKKGLIPILKKLIEHFFAVLLSLSAIIYLCSNDKTSQASWFIIGLAAVLSLIKALIESLKIIMISHKTENIADKEELMLSLGGKIFDILISVLGILQAGKVLKSTARIVKSYKSILSLVDDVAAVISKIASEIFK